MGRIKVVSHGGIVTRDSWLLVPSVECVEQYGGYVSLIFGFWKWRHRFIIQLPHWSDKHIFKNRGGSYVAFDPSNLHKLGAFNSRRDARIHLQAYRHLMAEAHERGRDDDDADDERDLS